MEENDVKNACVGTRFEIKIDKDEKILIQNLTRC